MKKQRIGSVVLLFCLLISLERVFASTTAPTGERWKNIVGEGYYIGSVVGWGNHFPLSDDSDWKADHREVFLRECNAGNSLPYPFGTWTGPYEYNFSKFNDAVNWLHDNNNYQSAHTLGGGGHYYAKWLKNGTFSNDDLEKMLEEFIKNIMQSNDNANKVDAWNVVNEAFAGDYPDSQYIWRPSPFLQLGWEPEQSGLTGADKKFDEVPVYIRKHFELARKYSPNAKLEYRDNNCEFPGNRKYQHNYQLARHMKNTNIPVDVYGFQLHSGIQNGRTYDYDALKANIKRYRDIGFEVWLQEVDARHDDNQAGVYVQREHMYNLVKAALEGGVTFINFWGMRDDPPERIMYWFEGVSTYDPKPSYYGIQQALDEFFGGNTN